MKDAEIISMSELNDEVLDYQSYALQLQTTQDALFEERERSQATLNAISDAVLATDHYGYVTYLNTAAKSMTGWSLTEAWGQPLASVFNLIAITTRLPALNPALSAIDKNCAVELEPDCMLVRRDATESAVEGSARPTHTRDGEVTGAVIVFHEVAVSPAMMRDLAFLAHHDFLTGLPNSALLEERLQLAMDQARRNRKQAALLFLDVDFFKEINDSLGHPAGDQVLKSLAKRLTRCVRNTDTVSRHGGDEFVVLLADISGPAEAGHIAEKLMAVFAEHPFIDGREIHLTLSIGISLFPSDGSCVEHILQNADTAMYHAKAMGRNNYQFFELTMNVQAVERLHLETGLRRALRDDEFALVFQPQIELTTGKLIGAEALIRWQHPERGLLLPEAFIPVAEDCGLIVKIGQWVLSETCRLIRGWLEAGHSVVPVAINISAAEFNQYRFIDHVQTALHATGVDAKYIQLELTESLLIQDSELSMTALKSLEAMGIKMAIDGFGSGYSSLAYLERFPIQTLKIAPSFVRNLHEDDGAKIVNAIIDMGRNLNYQVLAAGLETHEQLQRLKDRQCDLGQGLYFSPPLNAHDFSELLLPQAS